MLVWPISFWKLVTSLWPHEHENHKSWDKEWLIFVCYICYFWRIIVKHIICVRQYTPVRYHFLIKFWILHGKRISCKNFTVRAEQELSRSYVFNLELFNQMLVWPTSYWKLVTSLWPHEHENHKSWDKEWLIFVCYICYFWRIIVKHIICVR